MLPRQKEITKGKAALFFEAAGGPEYESVIFLLLSSDVVMLFVITRPAAPTERVARN
jgi:hypothetical protein